MIKPLKISPVNTTKHLGFKCEKCGTYGTIFLENSVANVDDRGELLEKEIFDCPKCNSRLN